MSTVSKIVDTATPIALNVVGMAAGVLEHRGINRILETEAVQGFLGNETATDVKRYFTPALVAATGFIISNSVPSTSPVKDIANGMAACGLANLGSELLFGKNVMAGLGNGFLGDIMGDDDLDLIAEENLDYEPEETNEMGRTLPSGSAKVAIPEASNIMGINNKELVIL